MSDDAEPTDLIRRAAAGEAQAVAQLFDRYRDRLRQMVQLRLDRRLQGRLDPSDVLQEAFLDLARPVPEYHADPALPFFLWLRFLTGQRLLQLHRYHLGTRKRDAEQVVSLYRGAMPQATSAAASPSRCCRRACSTAAACSGSSARRRSRRGCTAPTSPRPAGPRSPAVCRRRLGMVATRVLSSWAVPVERKKT